MPKVTSDYSLPFLRDLGSNFSNEDVERIWRNRVFPLVYTDDFTTNWSAVRDSNGRFVASTGARCRVEPRPHHAPQCQIPVRQLDGTSQQEQISYEAIIFGKVVHQLFLNESPDGSRKAARVRRRQFIDQFAKKLPIQWRGVVIQGNLHHYDKRGDHKGWFNKPDLYSLLASPENIRLITLLPNSDYNALIECTLYETDFALQPKYEALSYVWGAPGSTRRILLNGEMIPIRENLEAALRELRPRGISPRTLWIDAICINQSNLQERAQQVTRMDSIYRNAIGVVVWIGRESNTSARVFDGIDSIRRTFKGHEGFLGSQDFLKFAFQPEPYCSACDGVPHAVPTPLVTRLVGTHFSEREVDRISQAAQNPSILPQQWIDKHTESIEDLVRLLSRPWWRRVWVLQEAIMAKKLTLHCGSRSVDWPVFQGILYTQIRQGKRSRMHHLGSLSDGRRRGWAQMRLLRLANGTFAFFFLQSSLVAAQKLQSVSLADLLTLTWDFDATDPRDKLFALISLLPVNSRERVDFKPDYSANVEQLYTYVARNFLETSRRLDVMTARPLPPFDLQQRLGVETQHLEHELPSWVPNWMSPQLFQFNSIWVSDFSPLKTLNWYMDNCNHDHEPGLWSAGQNLQIFNASLHGISPFAFEFSAYDEILHTRGVLVDTIKELGQPWDLATTALRAYDPVNPSNSRSRDHAAQLSIIEQWKSVAGVDTEKAYPFTKQSRHETFWRTLFLDRYRSSSSDGLKYHIHRLPSQIGNQEAANIFSHAGIECAFPPKNLDDELLLIYFLRHEVTEMWTFASINLHCANLSLFRTQKGYIGVTHPNAQPGDKVAVLLGASVPLVLREYAEGHLLIGQRFVIF